MKVVIVSRHAPAIEWLAKQGIKGEVVSHVDDPAQITGCHVIGNLPLYLAVHAARTSQIMIPQRRGETRGRELTLEEMEAAGAVLQSFEVRLI